MDAANKFAFKLYGVTAATPGNYVSSPVSVRIAMTMATLGASSGTRDEMAAALGLPPSNEGILAAIANDRANSPPRDGAQLLVANRIYAEQSAPLRADYLQIMTQTFGAAPESVDFKSDAEGACAQINQWVAEQTQRRIRNLIPANALDKSTRVVLANALYFKAAWRHTFDHYATKNDDFYLGAGPRQLVPTMHLTRTFGYVETATARVLDLPYADSVFAMTILLPRARDGIGALETELLAGGLESALGTRDSRLVTVALPKFKFSWNANLVAAFNALKLRLPFIYIADFSAMSDALGRERLFISKIFHQAFIDVHEVGTEAAAATAVVMSSFGSMPKPEVPVPFVVDHPFLFLLRNLQTGRIYFIGRVVDPLQL
jgi:serpin B